MTKQLQTILLTAFLAILVNRAEAQWGAPVISMPNGTSALLGNVYGTAVAVVLRHDGTCTSKRLYDRNGNWGSVVFQDHEVVEIASTSTNWCGFPITPLDTDGHFLSVHLGDGATRWFLNQTVPHVSGWGGNGDDVIFALTPAAHSSAYSGGGNAGNDWVFGVQGSVLDGGDGDDAFCIAPGTSAGYVSGGAGGDALCGAADDYDSIDWYDPNCSC